MGNRKKSEVFFISLMSAQIEDFMFTDLANCLPRHIYKKIHTRYLLLRKSKLKRKMNLFIEYKSMQTSFQILNNNKNNNNTYLKKKEIAKKYCCKKLQMKFKNNACELLNDSNHNFIIIDRNHKYTNDTTITSIAIDKPLTVVQKKGFLHDAFYSFHAILSLFLGVSNEIKHRVKCEKVLLTEPRQTITSSKRILMNRRNYT